MLASIVLTVESHEDCTLPRNVGRAHYAAALQRIQDVDPALAQRVHDQDGPKPLTCSDILNARRNREGLHLAAGAPYFLRVTGLSADVSQALIQGLVNDPPTTWELDRRPLRLVQATVDPTVHGWAGQARYEELVADHLMGNGAPPRQVTLEFASPTAFKQAGRHMSIPLPDLVFGSLVERWNAFSPVVIGPEMRRFAGEMMAISRYRLESQPVVQKNGALRIGGVGRATYRAFSSDRYWLAAAQLLADFARFSGVGVQTATGMGQARRLPGG